MANRDFPSTADGLRVLLKDFTESREAEEPDKEKELQELKGMEGELRVFAMKRKKDIDIPDSKEIEEVSIVPCILIHIYMYSNFEHNCSMQPKLMSIHVHLNIHVAISHSATHVVYKSNCYFQCYAHGGPNQLMT